MVFINHTPPLIMSQLPLIHHHFQSHGCRVIEAGRKRKNKCRVGLTRLLRKGNVDGSKIRLSHFMALRANTVVCVCVCDSLWVLRYLVCHSLRVKYLSDMRTFLLSDMFTLARFSTITHSHLSL